MAREGVPPFDRSTVDGFAVVADDTFGCSDALPALLELAGEVEMGVDPDCVCAPGMCVRIPTGGKVPQGADAVVMLEYCEEYGRLYTWERARDACPTGWRLPTREDFDTLLAAVGGDSLAGNALKSFAGWNSAEDEGNGLDSYGFSGRPAGWKDLTGDYYQVGYFGRFWSISNRSDKHAYTLHLKYNAESGSLDYTSKESAISVRCVKE